MTVLALFPKRRKARVFLKNLIKKGIITRGEVIKLDMVLSGEKVIEKQGYGALFSTDQDLEAVKSIAASLFPETEVFFRTW